MATPNMSLTLPVVGVTAGPTYATQVNAALTVIDGHDHATGSGVQITPAGLNINADLSINSHNVTDVETVRFTAQPAALAGISPNLAALYVVNEDLYYNDGLGNQIAITTAGAVVGAPGNITNLLPPASVTYTSGGSPNYKFMSTATISANLDAASILMRNPGVTATYALTLQAPTLTNNYSITLPPIPLVPSFMEIDNSGIVTSTVPVSLGITAANLAADSVTNAKILNDAVTTAKILNANVTPAKLSFVPAVAPVVVNFTGVSSTVAPVGATTCTVIAWGGGGGGGGGGAGALNAGGGGGGASGAYVIETLPVVAGETINVAVGLGGGGGAAGLPGTVGSDTQVDAATSGWVIRAYGGGGALQGSAGAGGPGGDSGAGAAYSYGLGGNGGGPSAAGGNGQRSSRALAVAGMGASAGYGGGGSGAAGRAAAGAQSPGSNGAAAAANSAAGGGGGSGGIGGQAGGAGGSGYVTLIFNSTT